MTASSELQALFAKRRERAATSSSSADEAGGDSRQQQQQQHGATSNPAEEEERPTSPRRHSEPFNQREHQQSKLQSQSNHNNAHTIANANHKVHDASTSAGVGDSGVASAIGFVSGRRTNSGATGSSSQSGSIKPRHAHAQQEESFSNKEPAPSSKFRYLSSEDTAPPPSTGMGIHATRSTTEESLAYSAATSAAFSDDDDEEDDYNYTHDEQASSIVTGTTASHGSRRLAGESFLKSRQRPVPNINNTLSSSSSIRKPSSIAARSTSYTSSVTTSTTTDPTLASGGYGDGNGNGNGPSYRGGGPKRSTSDPSSSAAAAAYDPTITTATAGVTNNNKNTNVNSFPLFKRTSPRPSQPLPSSVSPASANSSQSSQQSKSNSYSYNNSSSAGNVNRTEISPTQQQQSTPTSSRDDYKKSSPPEPVPGDAHYHGGSRNHHNSTHNPSTIRKIRHNRPSEHQHEHHTHHHQSDARSSTDTSSIHDLIQQHEVFAKSDDDDDKQQQDSMSPTSMTRRQQQHQQQQGNHKRRSPRRIRSPRNNSKQSHHQAVSHNSLQSDEVSEDEDNNVYSLKQRTKRHHQHEERQRLEREAQFASRRAFSGSGSSETNTTTNNTISNPPLNNTSRRASVVTSVSASSANTAKVTNVNVNQVNVKAADVNANTAPVAAGVGVGRRQQPPSPINYQSDSSGGGELEASPLWRKIQMRQQQQREQQGSASGSASGADADVDAEQATTAVHAPPAAMPLAQGSKQQQVADARPEVASESASSNELQTQQQQQQQGPLGNDNHNDDDDDALSSHSSHSSKEEEGHNRNMTAFDYTTQQSNVNVNVASDGDAASVVTHSHSQPHPRRHQQGQQQQQSATQPQHFHFNDGDWNFSTTTTKPLVEESSKNESNNIPHGNGNALDDNADAFTDFASDALWPGDDVDNNRMTTTTTNADFDDDPFFSTSSPAAADGFGVWPEESSSSSPPPRSGAASHSSSGIYNDHDRDHDPNVIVIEENEGEGEHDNMNNQSHTWDTSADAAKILDNSSFERSFCDDTTTPPISSQEQHQQEQNQSLAYVLESTNDYGPTSTSHSRSHSRNSSADVDVDAFEENFFPTPIHANLGRGGVMHVQELQHGLLASEDEDDAPAISLFNLPTPPPPPSMPPPTQMEVKAMMTRQQQQPQGAAAAANANPAVSDVFSLAGQSVSSAGVSSHTHRSSSGKSHHTHNTTTTTTTNGTTTTVTTSASVSNSNSIMEKKVVLTPNKSFVCDGKVEHAICHPLNGNYLVARRISPYRTNSTTTASSASADFRIEEVDSVSGEPVLTTPNLMYDSELERRILATVAKQQDDETTTLSGGGNGNDAAGSSIGIGKSTSSKYAAANGSSSAAIATAAVRVRSKARSRSPLMLQGISNIVALASGTHRSQKQTRVKVAVMMNVSVAMAPAPSSSNQLSTKAGADVNVRNLMIIAVYTWGYSTTSSALSVALQSVILPPRSAAASLSSSQSKSNNDDDNDDHAYEYDTRTLRLADGILFLGGSMSMRGNNSRSRVRVACVFLSKPHVRDVWSHVVVSSEREPPLTLNNAQGPDMVTALSPNNRHDSSFLKHPSSSSSSSGSINSSAVDQQTKHKYLAVATKHGSYMTIFNYEGAVSTNRFGAETSSTSTITDVNGSESSSSSSLLLQVMCRLEARQALEPRACPASLFASSSSSNKGEGEEGEDDNDDDDEMLYDATTNGCTDLEWMPPSSIGSSLPLLAASFVEGVLVYQVSLPMIIVSAAEGDDAANTASVATAPSVILYPIAAARASYEGIRSVENSSCVPLRSSVTWVDLGPRSPPALALLFEASSKTPSSSASTNITNNAPSVFRLALGVLRFSLYGSPMTLNKNHGIGYHPLPLTFVYQDTLLPHNYDRDHVGNQAASSTAFLLTGSSSSLCVPCVQGQRVVPLSPSLMVSTNHHHQNQAKEQEIGTWSGSGAANRCRSSLNICDEDEYFSALVKPVALVPPGLDSRGAMIEHRKSDSDAVFHVFSQTICRRSRTGVLITQQSSGSTGNNTVAGRRQLERYDWEPPTQRHWLCRTLLVGVPKNKPSSSSKAAVGGGGDAEEFGGTHTEIVCELTCGENHSAGLSPVRLVCDFSPYSEQRFVAVILASTIGAIDATVKPDPIAFTILDVGTKAKKKTPQTPAEPFRLRHGRDAAFLHFEAALSSSPTSSAPASARTVLYRMLVINAEGTAMYGLSGRRAAASADGEGEVADNDAVEWSKDGAVRLALKDQQPGLYINARRIFAFSTACPYYFALVGTSPASTRSCLIVGGRRTERDATHPPKLTRMIPQKGSPTLWLEEGEVVTAVAELPPGPPTGPKKVLAPPLLAIATQHRVMLVTSDTLVKLQDIQTYLTCDSLLAMGSMCVSFFSSAKPRDQSRITMGYLCAGLKAPLHSGLIATLAHQRTSSQHYCAAPLLMALRPDRFCYMRSHASMCQVESDANEDMILLSNAMFRPALLLEPLCANAVALGRGEGGGGTNNHSAIDSETFHAMLFYVIESFGRRSSSEPLKDDEGLGRDGEFLWFFS
jgi:hypothetical protein